MLSDSLLKHSMTLKNKNKQNQNLTTHYTKIDFYTFCIVLTRYTMYTGHYQKNGAIQKGKTKKIMVHFFFFNGIVLLTGAYRIWK